MTHTITVDEQYRAKQLANVVNEIKRHCRIGKVKMKPGRVVPPIPLPMMPMPAPLRNWFDLPYVPTYTSDRTGPMPKTLC